VIRGVEDVAALYRYALCRQGVARLLGLEGWRANWERMLPLQADSETCCAKNMSSSANEIWWVLTGASYPFSRTSDA
jgi:hypothetical protein